MPRQYSCRQISIMPTRLKFSWDIKSVPYTIGLGSQSGYAEAVEVWSDFHDILEDSKLTWFSRDYLERFYNRSCIKTPKTWPVVCIGMLSRVIRVLRQLSMLFSIKTLCLLFPKSVDYISPVTCRRSNDESFQVFGMRLDSLVFNFKLLQKRQNCSWITADSDASECLKCRRQSTCESSCCYCQLDEVKEKTDSKNKKSVFVRNVKYCAIDGVLRHCDSAFGSGRALLYRLHQLAHANDPSDNNGRGDHGPSNRGTHVVAGRKGAPEILKKLPKWSTGYHIICVRSMDTDLMFITTPECWNLIHLCCMGLNYNVKRS